MTRLSRLELLLLSGNGVRDRVLMLLAANGPLKRADIVLAIRRDDKKIDRGLIYEEGSIRVLGTGG
jgi:hypothetical protein